MSVSLILKMGVNADYLNSEDSTKRDDKKYIHDLSDTKQAAELHRRLSGMLASLGRDEYVDVILEIVEPYFRDRTMEKSFVTTLGQTLHLQFCSFADRFENSGNGEVKCETNFSKENKIIISLRLNKAVIVPKPN